MISTGISGVDELVGGGIPPGGRVLYSMEPGAQGQLFLVSTFLSALAAGRSMLVILPNTTLGAFLHDAASLHGSPVDLAGHPVFFMDAVDRERIQRSGMTARARELEWQARIRKVCSENHIEIILAYFDLLYEDFGLERGLSLLDTADYGKRPAIILEHLNLEGDQLLERFIRDFRFDLVIAIYSSFPPNPQFSYFTLAHISWARLPKRSVPFMVTGGKLIPYIPRIVITGPAGSGKSTFVTSASDDGHSIDRQGAAGDTTTVAMDFGNLHWDHFDITLYGTPGHSRFDPLIPSLLKYAMGAVIVVDAGDPAAFPRARELLANLEKHRIPVVIAANKAALPGASDEKTIRQGLGITGTVPVFFINARNRADTHRVLESMVDHITRVSY